MVKIRNGVQTVGMCVATIARTEMDGDKEQCYAFGQLHYVGTMISIAR